MACSIACTKLVGKKNNILMWRKHSGGTCGEGSIGNPPADSQCSGTESQQTR